TDLKKYKNKFVKKIHMNKKINTLSYKLIKMHVFLIYCFIKQINTIYLYQLQGSYLKLKRVQLRDSAEP
ncbi:hypothetical protein, partial [Flavobacterium oreochromis]|uniref:hypothetical protein n=1 Tax=Flavobacterium oreochromis TaxID=2906078 RepID=UPI000B666714